MAAKVAARSISRRFYSSGSGRILSEEEKAAENVYIKKIEQEKLEKLARKGPKPGETPPPPVSGSGGSTTDVNPGSSASASSGVSTDKYRNYAVVAGLVTGLGALGWYLKASAKKPEEVQD